MKTKPGWMATGYVQDAQKILSGSRVMFRIQTWGQVQFQRCFPHLKKFSVSWHHWTDTLNTPIQGLYLQLYFKTCWNSPHLFQNRYKTACCIHPSHHKVINKIGMVECREQWRQGCNAPIKSHQGTGKRWWEGVCLCVCGWWWWCGGKQGQSEGGGVKGSVKKVMCGRFFPSLRDTPWPVHGHGLYLDKTKQKVQGISMRCSARNNNNKKNSYKQLRSLLPGSTSGILKYPRQTLLLR